MKRVICPKCGTPLGRYPDDYIEVITDCFNCRTQVTARQKKKRGIKQNYALGQFQIPTTVHYDLFDDKIVENAVFDPTDGLNDRIDCDLMLEKLDGVDREICQYLIDGYSLREIAKKIGRSHQVVHYWIKRIGKKLKAL